MSSTIHASDVSGSEFCKAEEFVLSLPPGSAVAVLLQGFLNAVSRGSDVTLLEQGVELSSSQVADVLKVSRPHAVKLMDQGLLAFRLVGTHRRVSVEDLMDYVERHERANAHVQGLLGTREHGLKRIKDAAAELTSDDVEELSRLTP